MLELDNNKKVCTKCFEEKTYDLFTISGKRKDGTPVLGWCRQCQNDINKLNYTLNKDKHSKLRKERYRRDKDKEIRYALDRHTRIRNSFLQMYGSVCSCCGESEKVFLCLDHVLGQKGKKKQNSTSAYKQAVENYDPNVFRILCMNCNQATRFGDTCPHQLRKETLP